MSFSNQRRPTSFIQFLSNTSLTHGTLTQTLHSYNLVQPMAYTKIWHTSILHKFDFFHWRISYQNNSFLLKLQLNLSKNLNKRSVILIGVGYMITFSSFRFVKSYMLCQIKKIHIIFYYRIPCQFWSFPLPSPPPPKKI